MKYKEAKVSKSFRLTADQVAFIESQKGEGLTEKLSGILDEYRKGESDRKKDIAYYEKIIAKRKEELRRFSDLSMKLASIRNEAIRLESTFCRIMESLREENTRDE